MSDLDQDSEAGGLAAALEDLLDGRAEEMHTALPGKIERYDASAQVADVTPLIKRRIPALGGGLASEAMPTIRAVPVVWPRAGDWFMHMPLAAGDTVLLVCCERDLSGWRRTGQLADPIDVRAHHLAHAVAIPGVYPRTRQLADTPSDALVIGRDGGSTIRVRADGQIYVAGSGSLALATNLAVHLAAIATALDAISGGTNPTYGAAAKAALDASNPIPSTLTKGA